MSDSGKPPQHLLDAVKQGKYIDPKDPWVRKMLREERKKEKQKKIAEEKKYQEFLEERAIQHLLMEGEEFEKLQTDNLNTVNWNYTRKCKWCESTSMRIVVRPDIMHLAGYRCNLCDKYNDWLPYKSDLSYWSETK